MVSLMASTQSGLKVGRKKLRVNIKMVKKMAAGQSTMLPEKRNQQSLIKMEVQMVSGQRGTQTVTKNRNLSGRMVA